jgi:hypothetical protein
MSFRPGRKKRRLARVDHDLYWDALDDFGEVAGGIVWRQQGEL